MLQEGSLYHFITDLPAMKPLARQVVQLVAHGTMVSRCRTEDGRTFAAFNSELRIDPRLNGGRE
jgi:hypothetical protein